MSSLRRLPSMDYRTELSSSSSRNLSRHFSLPAPSLRRQRQRPPVCFPRKASLGNGGHGSRFRFLPPACGSTQDRSLRKLTPCRSLPARADDREGDRTVRPKTHSVSRDAVQDSVVYKDLCESVHLHVPGSTRCWLSSEGILHPIVQDNCRQSRAEKIVDLSSSGVPVSMRMLKRRLSSKPEMKLSRASSRQSVAGDPCIHPALGKEVHADNLLSDVPGSVNSAFGMLIFMMESLQQHALRLRNAVLCEADVQLHLMMERVRQEMQDTFLWLFQMVFACTPKLMLLTMILLADFAAHSMGSHIALAVPPMGEPPTYAIERSVPASMLSVDLRHRSFENSGGVNTPKRNGILLEPYLSDGGAGGGVARAVKAGGGMDGGATLSNLLTDQAAFTSQEETYLASDASSVGSSNGLRDARSNLEENQRLAAMCQHALSKEFMSDPVAKCARIIVAPVHAPALEADDYTCFDRTDLCYQHELSRDPKNPLLLANYAQFQHVVRHNHDRADELYKRAVKADPVDGELMGKYASFLWIAKEDLEAADEAYMAALAVDPSNAYYAGSYAHFLWTSGADEDDMSTTNCNYREVSAS